MLNCSQYFTESLILRTYISLNRPTINNKRQTIIEYKLLNTERGYKI